MICRWCNRHFDTPEPGDPEVTTYHIPQAIRVTRDTVAISDSHGRYIREIDVDLCSWSCVEAYAAYQVVTLESDQPSGDQAIAARDGYLKRMSQVDHRLAAVRQSIEQAGIDVDRLGRPEPRVDQELRTIGYWVPLDPSDGLEGSEAVSASSGPNIPRLTAEYQRLQDEAAHGRDADPVWMPHVPIDPTPSRRGPVAGMIGSSIPPKSEGL